MAWLSLPGMAKYDQHLAREYPMCKKCSIKKPPRTHYCKWCHLCVFKFDHHCPWLNNCVALYNHRYFLQFCCFMAIECFYAGTLAYREYQIGRLGKEVFSYQDIFLRPSDIVNTMGILVFPRYIIFIGALTISFLLMALIWWHGRVIGRSVTSLERVPNQHRAQRCAEKGCIFVNPYDFGFVRNLDTIF